MTKLARLPLPVRFTFEQKRCKVHNLLQERRGSGRIVNRGARSHPEWISLEAPRD